LTWNYFLFAYLLVPLSAIAYIVFAGWVGYRASKAARKAVTKVAAAASVFLALVLIPAADVIKGRIQFSRYCATEAGVTVRRTATLLEDDFRTDGYLKRELLPGYRGFKLGARYSTQSSSTEVARQPRIERSRSAILDNKTGEVLGEVIDFRYWGGWFVHYLPGHVSAERCGSLRAHPTLEAMVFTNYPSGK
jgi:hypothetical protein